jgi:hypothetical protein
VWFILPHFYNIIITWTTLSLSLYWTNQLQTQLTTTKKKKDISLSELLDSLITLLFDSIHHAPLNEHSLIFSRFLLLLSLFSIFTYYYLLLHANFFFNHYLLGFRFLPIVNVNTCFLRLYQFFFYFWKKGKKKLRKTRFSFHFSSKHNVDVKST